MYYRVESLYVFRPHKVNGFKSHDLGEWKIGIKKNDYKRSYSWERDYEYFQVLTENNKKVYVCYIEEPEKNDVVARFIKPLDFFFDTQKKYFTVKEIKEMEDLLNEKERNRLQKKDAKKNIQVKPEAVEQTTTEIKEENKEEIKKQKEDEENDL